MPLTGHIVVLDRPDLTLDFVFFEDTEMSVEADWERVSIRGRSEPYHFYGSTGVRSWPWTIQFWAGVDPQNLTPNQVLDRVRFLERLQYPIVANGLLKEPPAVSFKVGNFLDSTGLIKGLKVSWKAPFDYETQLYHGAEVSFTFEEVRDEPLHFDSDFFVRRNS